MKKSATVSKNSSELARVVAQNTLATIQNIIDLKKISLKQTHLSLKIYTE